MPNSALHLTRARRVLWLFKFLPWARAGELEGYTDSDNILPKIRLSKVIWQEQSDEGKRKKRNCY